LEVTYTAGTASTNDVYNTSQHITEGKVEGAVNVFVSNDMAEYTGARSNTGSGESFINYGRQWGGISPLEPDVGVLAHELGHQFGYNSENGWTNLLADVQIERDNAFLRAGQTSQTYMAPGPGRNSTHVMVPKTRPVPSIKVYREGTRRFAVRKN
jgi:hypothetical protein